MERLSKAGSSEDEEVPSRGASTHGAESEEEQHCTKSIKLRSTGRTLSLELTPPPPAQTPPQRTMEELAVLFEECLEEVAQLERRRDVLVQEFVQQEETMLQAVQVLWQRLADARGQLGGALLHKHRLQEEVWQVKRKLFSVARSCVQSQVTMAAQQYEVAQSALTREELQSQILDLLQEAAQLREAHGGQLASLQAGPMAGARARSMADLSHCRRASLELSQQVQGSMRRLEEWYEPKVLALLRRRQLVLEALRRCRELGQDLKNHLGPLREENQRLEQQRSSLEQRMALMEEERRDRMAKHRDAVSSLEESIGDLRTELQVHIYTNRQLSELNASLLEKLGLYRKILRCQEGSYMPTEEGGEL